MISAEINRWLPLLTVPVMADTKADLKRILLGVLGSQISTRVFEELSRLENDDWDTLMALAGRLHVLPLFAHRLIQPNSGVHLPPVVREQLRHRYLMNAARNLKLYRELATIVEVLEAHGIQVIVLKGMHLAQTVYSNIALRQIGDIDILVPPRQAQSACDALLAIGYKRHTGQLRAVDSEVMLSFLPHVAPLMKSGCSSVEIHESITIPNQPLFIDMDGIWGRAEPLNQAGMKMRGLCPEDLLLHICEHVSYHHRFEWGLRPYCDIAQIIYYFGERLDWSSLCERAEHWGCARGIALAMAVANKLIGALVPQFVIDSLGEIRIHGDIVQVAIDHSLAYPLHAAMSNDLASLFGRASFFARLQQFFASVIQPPAVMVAFYPVRPGSPTIIWYYLVRAYSLLRRYWRTAWRLQRATDPALNACVRRKNVLDEFLAPS